MGSALPQLQFETLDPIPNPASSSYSSALPGYGDSASSAASSVSASSSYASAPASAPIIRTVKKTIVKNEALPTTTFIRRVPAPAAPLSVTSSSTSSSTSTRRVVKRPRIAIVRSVYNAPTSANSDWNYAYEGENGIQQEAEGTVERIGDVDVVTMRGSYSYPGTDGLTYVVDWYADDTGFHPSAPHLPRSVPIPFPEQARAVEAQLRFAAEQRSLAAASENIETVAKLPGYDN